MVTCCNQYTVQSKVPCAVKIRNLGNYFNLSFPPVSLNDAVMVSVNFSDQIGCNDRVVEAIFSFPSQITAWQSIIDDEPTAVFNGRIAGNYTCQISAKTDSGNTYQSFISFSVLTTASLISPTVPDYAPNAFYAWGAVILDTNSTPMILG